MDGDGELNHILYINLGNTGGEGVIWAFPQKVILFNQLWVLSSILTLSSL